MLTVDPSSGLLSPPNLFLKAAMSSVTLSLETLICAVNVGTLQPNHQPGLEAEGGIFRQKALSDQ